MSQLSPAVQHRKLPHLECLCVWQLASWHHPQAGSFSLVTSPQEKWGFLCLGTKESFLMLCGRAKAFCLHITALCRCLRWAFGGGGSAVFCWVSLGGSVGHRFRACIISGCGVPTAPLSHSLCVSMPSIHLPCPSSVPPAQGRGSHACSVCRNSLWNAEEVILCYHW